ncbi:FAD-dependent oxidoreductase [Pseudonocardia sp. GCM10023141]|uniref:FAD-dependent oxidoreductase n=1 Tax=Pseudonocardia sp. GCM10023141 TaxID=3252653 RepID=UPI00361E2E2F
MDVVVVGGGLVGLTTALVLRHHGVDVTLVERRATTSPQPKARRLNMRSMEIFREMGLEPTVHDAARDLADHDHTAVGRTLAECEQLPLWRPPGVAGLAVEVSPALPCLIAQDVLEPVLRAAAVTAGVDVRFGTEALGCSQDADGVQVQLPGRSLRAAFVVAADGPRSPVREALGIARSGRGALGEPIVNVYFRADLADVVRGREFNLCSIEHPDAPGTLASIGGDRWVFMARCVPERDWPVVLRTALGVPAPDLQVLSALSWQPEMRIAERFADGRIFLAGDAAHVMPPWAAAGANTGIADAHNLGWKLAAVLRGPAGPALLDSYDVERRTAGWFAAEQSSMRMGDPGGTRPGHAHPYVLAVSGAQYRDGALCGVVEPEPITEFAPAGRVGTRVPHVRLPDGRSTLDLAGPGWALLVAPDVPDLPAAPDLPVHRISVDFLPPGHALLLRPDHVVAWRGVNPAEAAAARAALLGVPSRTTLS